MIGFVMRGMSPQSEVSEENQETDQGASEEKGFLLRICAGAPLLSDRNVKVYMYRKQ
ncbi:MAG: hypothetical protein K2P63_15715 [Lachnospiraceae bacterium]|nr:hypothetical protein [Lachnospiraceae bacterium]